MRASRTGPVTGMVAQLLLLGVLAATVGLGTRGWAVGVACAVTTNAVLWRMIVRDGCVRLGPATRVTLGRGALAVGVAALTADGAGGAAGVILVVLAGTAVALDGVDGWVARRTASESPLGAALDGEVDAFLILVLSVRVAQTVGVWALAIGLARYAFLAAGWVWPWMRARLPFRYWRKVVTATQGIVLTAAAAQVLPLAVSRVAVLAALALLAESFGRDVWWLWRRRAAPGTPHGAPVPPGAIATTLAVLVVWLALVTPNRLPGLTAGQLARIPVEGLLLVALAVALPATPRRVLAVLGGVAAGGLLVVRMLDMGFLTMFDRPFNPVEDWAYAGIGVETLRTSVGAWRANLAVAAAAVLVAGVMVVTPLALLRVTRRAAAHRRGALTAVALLGVVCAVTALTGPRVAATRAADAAVHEARAVRTGLAGRAEFARELRDDRLRDTPAQRLLTGLRGKDVLLVFVESYGRVAVQDSWFAPPITALLDRGTAQLRADGFGARSAFLRSSTFGGLSWLAHGTLQAGVWVDGKRRYDQLVTSDRLTLATAFRRAGWRTVAVAPANNRTWPEGTTFYRYSAIHDQRDLGYRGPRFAFGTMPDQYVMLALQRMELSRHPRPGVFAEVDLVSSHEPWTRIPRQVPWDQVGDGAVFHRVPAEPTRAAGAFSDPTGAQRDYGRSIEYTLATLVSYVRRFGGDDLVLIMVGDHQPATIITGQNPTHDVPVTLIARDPAVLARMAGWGWQAGIRPGPTAPVWPMDAFRDRFLTAFGPRTG